MKSILSYVAVNRFRLGAALALVLGMMFGLIDPAVAALGGGILLDTSPEELFKKVLQEHSAAIRDFSKKTSDEVIALRSQIVDLAQKMSTGYVPGSGGGGPTQLADIITKADGFAALREGKIRDLRIPIPGGLGFKTQIVNASGASQPLVAADRQREIITSLPQALRIRDLIPVLPTTSNMVEFPSESSFTNNARPQGDASPVGGGEGEEFAESAFTFTLSSAAVVTIGHWVPASQQVLDDAQVLGDFLSTRLLYGLKLKEETDILTGTGGANTLNGLNNQATAYNRGATNDTLLDTLAKAKTQLQLANCEPNGVVLNPADFLTLATAKDSQLRYVWGDPNMGAIPIVWGLPIVISNSQTSGRFTMADFVRAARLWDRTEAMVELSTSHSDFFTRHMVAIKCWERVALTVYRSTAMVYGNVSHLG